MYFERTKERRHSLLLFSNVPRGRERGGRRKERTVRRGMNKGNGTLMRTAPYTCHARTREGTCVCVCGYASASLVARKGQRRGISGCSFCKYLKSRRVVDRGCAAPHASAMEFSILWLEIVLINETTWPFETLFAYTTDTCIRAVCYIIRHRRRSVSILRDLTDILRLIGSLCSSRECRSKLSLRTRRV